ncbi:MAG: hypothetical protein ACI8X5_003558 [Planctomycetota bacterium]|jgi:hypothetical protein
MKRSNRIRVALFFVVLAYLIITLLPSPGQVALGDELAYTFQSEVLGGAHVKELSDLRGKPLLVEFWGTH